MSAQTRDQVDPKATQTVGQLPPQANLVIYQGDDFYLNVTVNDPNGMLNLNLYTPKSQIRSTTSATDVLATFDVVVIDAITLQLHLTSVQSTRLPAASVWDLQITDAAGIVTTLVAGTVTAAREVTR